ncbi:MAG: hypothetical protein ABI851_15575, partial [Saprospiraceae bacterium]
PSSPRKSLDLRDELRDQFKYVVKPLFAISNLSPWRLRRHALSSLIVLANPWICGMSYETNLFEKSSFISPFSQMDRKDTFSFLFC